ncbi:MAG: 2'-5' RNA ligase family protein [Hyphomonas sp.]
MKEEAVSYWCLPCAADAPRYAAIIETLALAQGAVAFAPHLTLATLSGPADDLRDVIAALRGLILEPLEIDGTDVFTTSLFIRFKASDALVYARRLMEAPPGFRPGRTFDPHISLCYGPPPDAPKLTPSLQTLLAHPVRFDRLAAMKITLPVETHADVASWRMAASHPL